MQRLLSFRFIYCKNEVVIVMSSCTIDIIKFTLKMKHMLVENKYNWFCFSICSETQVINKSKTMSSGNSPMSKLGVLF